MASRHSLRRLELSACVALLSLAPLACQSDPGRDEGDDTGDDTGVAASSARPADDTSTRVPARNTDDDSSESSGPPASDSPASARSGEDIASPPPAAAPASEAAEAPAARAVTFAACTTAGGPYSDCDTIYVTAVQQAPARCIQLTIDNCGTYGRQGLAADTPRSWRLASGSVGAASTPCELGVFYSGNPSLANATGAITWNEDTPDPTDLSFDLSLELSGATSDPIPLATTEPLQPTDCEQ